MRLVVTGGLGFIGSNFVRMVLERHPDWRVTNLDLATYAGNPANLEDVAAHRGYRFVKGDIAEPADLARALEGGADAIVNFAAESHVDRSILAAGPFVRTNVLGTVQVLEAARAAGSCRVVHVSTDEVYGALGPADAPFTEATPLNPTSPYAASKAAADLLALAFARTYGQDVVLTRCSNNYGPYQFPEKLIPLMISNALEGLRLPVYGDGRQVRDWIHVADHCEGVLAALERGRAGEVYNFGARAERANLDIVSRIVVLTGVAPGLVEHVTDRPAHDRRYAMDPAKAERELGWRPRRSFEEGLADTVRWYVEHERWWRAVKDGSYRDFYRTWYEERAS
ncbi:MAG TPA: dTDP-glucose 4,6-dehydratase [Gemmatimonadales bacterium]|nr:dTDP-glucose 4,6-dehydratase [Gemmatimonadales bacterium]